ncbi:outer membrane protein assembly factor BamE [Heyndrickxia faecalis]|uniref:outer membrane protein assembly factor BamE n=1 Tax=Heyndrickxia faecalis TaxID=2824910 RepID=UPI0032B1476D
MRKIVISLITLSVILSLMGCGKPQAQAPKRHVNYIAPTEYKNLKIGMTKKQVIKEIGKPTKKDPNNSNMWYYSIKHKLAKDSYVILTFDMSNDINSTAYVLIRKEQKGLLTDYDTTVDEFTGKDTNDKSNTASSDSSSDTVESDTMKGASSSSELKLAAKKADKDNVKTAYIKDKIAVIEFKDEFETNEKTMLQNFALYSTRIMEKEKNNSNVNGFAFIRDTTFENTKGNKSTGTAIIAYFTKKDANSISYENFLQLVDLDPYKFYKASSGYFINPAIYKNAKSYMHGLPAYKNSSDYKLSDDFSEDLAS